MGNSLKGQMYKSSTSTFWKKQKTKTNIVGRNRTTVNAIVRVSIRSRNFGALRARGLIHAPGLPMGSEPWLACACKRSRRPRAPGEKASADLKKLQQIFTVVQLASNLSDNRSRMSKMKIPRAPRTLKCVPNLGPTSPTPLHSRSQRSKHRWSSNLLRASTTLWGERWASFSRRGRSAQKSAWFGPSLW